MQDVIQRFDKSQVTFYKNLAIYYEPLEIRFPGKPSESQRTELKSMGFHPRKDENGDWLWRGHDTWRARMYLKEYATDCGEIGQKMTTQEKVEQQLERSERRAGRLNDAANRYAKNGHDTLARAHQMAEIIPFGQPVMGQADRNYRERIHRTQGRGFQQLDEAEKLRYQAEAAAKFGKRKMNPLTTRRRVERLETDLRRTILHMEKEIGRYDLYLKMYGRDSEYAEKLSRSALEYLESEANKIEEELNFWRQYVEDMGFKSWGKDDFEKGDVVRTSGELCVVEKVNPKSLNIWNPARTDFFARRKVVYTDLRQDCKDISDEDHKHVDEVIMRALGKTGPISE